MNVFGKRLAWILSLALSTPASQGLAAQNACDPVLKTDMTDPLAYQPRADRCEGLFVQQVRGGIQVASVHFAPRTFAAGAGRTVQLSWRSMLKLPSHLRAVSLKPKVYYRMDALRPPESTSYSWPTDLLERSGLSGNDIGLLSWQTTKIAGRETEVFSPVSVEGGADHIEIVLLPDLPLEEVYLGLAPVDDDGRGGEYLFTDRSLQYGIYPERRPITARLPLLETAGVYQLEVSVLFKSGGSSSQDVLFYYPGK
jgi:hypothetical protein